MKSHTRLIRFFVAVLSMGALLLVSAACGGGGSENSPVGMSDTTGEQAQALPQQQAAGGAGSDASGRDTVKTVPGTVPGEKEPPLTEPAGTGRAIVYTANLSVRAKNVDAGAVKAKQLVTAAGGHVANETSSTEPPSARIVFRVPAERYTTVLDQLAGQIGTRLGMQQEAEDVTAEMADVASRVKSAESTLASFRKLLNHANTIGEVLNVEQEISRREADLEALQARQKALGQQTRFATVTLEIDGPAAKSKSDPREGGFIGGIKAGWSAFTTLLSGLALVTGWLLPFAPIAAVAATIVIWLRRRGPRGETGTRTNAGTNPKTDTNPNTDTNTGPVASGGPVAQAGAGTDAGAGDAKAP